MKCRAIDRKTWRAKDGGEFLAAMIDSFRAPLCEETAIAQTTLGPRCKKHLQEFREAMADPHTLGNVIGGRPRTPEEIEAMIRILS